MALVQTGAKYALSNSALGPSLVLASTSNNASLVVEAPRASADSQLWYVSATNDSSRFRLHTVQKGDYWALDMVSYIGSPQMDLHFFSKGDYNGQLWRFDKWGENADIKISNLYTGVDIRLEVGTSRQAKLVGGDTPGQHWTLSKIGSTATSTATATTLSTALATTLTTTTATATTSGGATATPTQSGSSNTQGGESWSTGKIAGASVGGVVGLAILAGVAYLLWKHFKKPSRGQYEQANEVFM
ncbi:hypothetical protein B0J11DRAFT_540222 [Dendryphion nanum]|uniref:Ricin B lectin domain-containing protein n=1 Tax=Dendryphion nanum TaxID=256645 RepID=A0A9P9DA59_9PLEO|nr:hypothetical protein B0J11DRAFT_540222 [Dendryphion nanum]